jgi:prefoldin subunit 5
MSELNAVLETLKTIGANVGAIDRMVRHLSQQVSGLEAGQALLNDQITVLQQDVREVRTAINDMEKTRFTDGEAQALHTRAREDIYKLTVKVGKLEARA